MRQQIADRWVEGRAAYLAVFAFALALIAVALIALALITIAPPPLGPTLTTYNDTYTRAQFSERVAGQIERFDFEIVCIGHVQHLAQTVIPLRDHSIDSYRALAFYAAACADYLEGAAWADPQSISN